MPDTSEISRPMAELNMEADRLKAQVLNYERAHAFPGMFTEAKLREMRADAYVIELRIDSMRKIAKRFADSIDQWAANHRSRQEREGAAS